MITLLLRWLFNNAKFEIYASPTAIGRRLGGHDFPNLPDEFIILDIRAGDSIIVFGYFQAV
jgi:hypothetical protein